MPMINSAKKDRCISDENYNEGSNISESCTDAWSRVENCQREILSPQGIQVESETMEIWLWDREDFQKLDKRIIDAVLAYTAIGLSRQLQQAWKEKEEDAEKMAQMQSMAVKYLFDGITQHDDKEK